MEMPVWQRFRKLIGSNFMQYQINKFFLSTIALMFCCFVVVMAQQPKPTKQQRPTKHPTQFDKILDSDDKQPVGSEPNEAGKTEQTATPKTTLQSSDALVQAVLNLTVEVKNLVNEVRANNSRQQIQTDILRLNRTDLRIDRYESELKTVRDRLAILEGEAQNLQLILTPEGLEAQVSRMPYANKGDAIRQVKDNLEARLRVVTTEKELVQRREAELAGVLKGFREASSETEKRLQAIEDSLKKLAPTEAPEHADKAKPDTQDK